MNTRPNFISAAASLLVSSSLLLSCSSTTTSPRTPAEENHAMMDHSHMRMADQPGGTKADCRSTQRTVTPEQQKIINSIVGDRVHRLNHALWHATRGGLGVKDLSETVKAFGVTWKESHPYCPAPDADFESSNYNPVGEDFLFMHRVMVEQVRRELIQAGLPCIEEWTRIPDPKAFPLPDSSTSGAKSPKALAQLQAWDKYLQNPEWLAGKSLSQLGMALELTTHNNLHMRYATEKPAIGTEDGAPVPYNGVFPKDWVYDSPQYNWLADPYGAALNPTFWRIHGYVDAFIDKWLAAHKNPNGNIQYRSISANCGGKADCYQWKGQWTGSIPQSYDNDQPKDKVVRASAPDPKDPFNYAVAQACSPPPKAARPPQDPTKEFNHERMQRQWLGVIGGAPSP